MDQVASRPVEDTTEAVAGGRYLLGRRLAADRRRRVHEAWDTRLERTVALVLITPAGGTDPDPTLPASPVTTFHLHPPGLVELYDGGAHQDEIFLVCQRVPGPTLADRLPAMRATELADVVCRLIGTLAPLHRRGAAHGGLTPACILLGGPRPMIADWGVAALVERWAGPPEDTRHRAPEQDHGETGPAADVHALGRMLRDSRGGLRSRRDRELRALARRMTTPDPRARPGVEDVAAALADLGREDRPRAGGGPRPRLVGAAVAAAAAAAGLVLGVGAVLPLIQPSTGGASALVAPPEPGAPTTGPSVSRLPVSSVAPRHPSAPVEVPPVASTARADTLAVTGTSDDGSTHPSPAPTTTRATLQTTPQTTSPTTSRTTSVTPAAPPTGSPTASSTTTRTSPPSRSPETDTDAAERTSGGPEAERPRSAPTPGTDVDDDDDEDEDEDEDEDS